MHDRTIEKNDWKKKKHDSRVKTQKGQSRAKMRKFSKTYGQSEQKNEKSTTRKHLKPLWGPQTLPKPKNLNLLFKSSFPKLLSLSRWVLTSVKLAYSETRKKWIFLRCLIFKEFVFPEKALETCHLFARPNCKNKYFEPDHQIPSQFPIRRFLTVITNFWEP